MGNKIQYILGRINVIALFLIIFSCKSSKIITTGKVDAGLSAKAIIKSHYQNHLQFQTLSGRLKIDYSDGESSQSVSVSLRMKKDKAIWMSAPLGMVKAYITPDRVTFYNKLQNEYFDGDFSYLSQLLGTRLDFEKVQNLLLGQALMNLKEGKYNVSVSEENYQLQPKRPMDLFKIIFQIEPKNFKMAGQQISQPLKKRLLDIKYKNYQKIDKWVLPNEIMIVAVEGHQQNTISLIYRNMEFDRPLNFPYKIPKGFKEIILK